MPLPTLDIERILRETLVAEVQHYATLGSTNDHAKSLAQGSGKLPCLIVADQQTSGRGRGANRWWSGQGSLTFSLLLAPSQLPMAPQQWPLVSLAAGIAVVDAAAPLVPDHTAGIHWPNDVYVDGRKLGGILVEVTPSRVCVVGIGLNANNSLEEAPAEIREKATTLLELTGRIHDRTEILVRVLTGLESLLAALAKEPETVAARANRLCLQHGRALTVRLADRWVTGRCAGIAQDGALVLETAGGQEKVYSGTLS